MAETEKKNIVISTSVDQKGLQEGLGKSQSLIKGFVGGAAQELLGINELFKAAAGGPASLSDILRK